MMRYLKKTKRFEGKVKACGEGDDGDQEEQVTSCGGAYANATRTMDEQSSLSSQSRVALAVKCKVTQSQAKAGDAVRNRML